MIHSFSFSFSFSLLHEVMDVMGKAEPDTDAVDMASDILKVIKAQEMLRKSRIDKTRLVALKVIAAAGKKGTFDVYNLILERRRSC